MTEVLKKLILNAFIHRGDIKFTTEDGIASLHLSKGAHWVTCGNVNVFDSSGSPTENIS